MNITKTASRVMLLLAVCGLALTLSSCKEATKVAGGAIAGYVITESLDCAVKGECPNAKANSKNSPNKAIEDYYQLINRRQYTDSWAILSRRFKNIKPDDNFKNYEEWWDKVDKVTINSLQLIEENDGTATLYADLRYLMRDGRQISDPSKISLIFDSNGKWLIDAKSKS